MKYFLSLLFILFSDNSWSWEVRGYTLGQFRVQTPWLKSNPHTFGLTTFENINRLNLYHTNSHEVSFEMGLDINQIWQKVDDPLLQREFLKEDIPYRLTNPDPRFIRSVSDNQAYYLLMSLDRFMLSYTHNKFDISLGRQQIAFGSAKLVNPTDIFVPFGPSAINKEERTGIDAIRVKRALGPNSEMDFGFIAGEKNKNRNSAMYLRNIFQMQSVEVKPLLTWYQEALGAGLDLLTSIKGANVYLETMSTRPHRRKTYNRSTAGVEYQWNDDIFTVFEYHFNGDGKENENQYDIAGSSFAISKGGSFLLGRHYINGLLSWQLSPLHMLSFSVYQNLSDESRLASPSWDWSLQENTNLITGVHLGLGKESSNPLLIKSEFGSYGHSFYTKLIHFF